MPWAWPLGGLEVAVIKQPGRDVISKSESNGGGAEMQSLKAPFHAHAMLAPTAARDVMRAQMLLSTARV